jgi:hypothetical protein
MILSTFLIREQFQIIQLMNSFARKESHPCSHPPESALSRLSPPCPVSEISVPRDFRQHSLITLLDKVSIRLLS